MNITETIRKNKLISGVLISLILLILLSLFQTSTCNGVTGYGSCHTENGKVIHSSPLNSLLN